MLLGVLLAGITGCGDGGGGSSASRDDAGAATAGDEARDPRPVLLVLGDSLTAGYGVADAEAWPALLEARAAARGLRVVNAGISGDTTAGGASRLPWYRSEPVAVVLLALGGNDGLRGIPPATVRDNLRAMIAKARDLWPDARVVLAGMQAPPSMGEDFTRDFAAVWPSLAREEEVALLPFLLEGVGGEPEMNQDDGIHPNPAGHARIADHVWATLEPLLPARVPPGSADDPAGRPR